MKILGIPLILFVLILFFNVVLAKQDIDECHSGKNKCHKYASCTKTKGSYKCKCKRGYEGNGVKCTDIDECVTKKIKCTKNALCTNTLGNYRCTCKPGYKPNGRKCNVFDAKLVKLGYPASCSDYGRSNGRLENGHYLIDPDGKGGQSPMRVFCDMRDKKGVGVTVIDHDSKERTLVNNCESVGCYSRRVDYNGANRVQLAQLTSISTHCEQFIKYECYSAVILHNGYSWLESRDGSRMKYWGGASPGSNKCACGMTKSCALKSRFCNCDKNDNKWREDSGLLTHKPDLPVSKLNFGDTGSSEEKGFYQLGALKCYNELGKCVRNSCLNGATCIDGVKDYKCKCSAGFTGKRCQKDIDECSTKKNICGKGAFCIDTTGSYKCECKFGYQRDGSKCTDIDECTMGKKICGKHGQCINTQGLYKCQCSKGYEWDGAECADIDECMMWNNKCGKHGVCVNVEGSFKCRCQKGYMKQRGICEGFKWSSSRSTRDITAWALAVVNLLALIAYVR